AARDMDIVTVMPVMTKTADGGRQLRIPPEAGYDGEIFEFGAAG
ncbi:MAG: NUDIX hydrolase, partial [Bradyrhizobium sp.]|nr:NUDIX hydrolase [Bradyrhizobium sp.]